MIALKGRHLLPTARGMGWKWALVVPLFFGHWEEGRAHFKRLCGFIVLRERGRAMSFLPSFIWRRLGGLELLKGAWGQRISFLGTGPHSS